MENKQKRVIVAAIGTFLEWAEFTYFAYIANIIAALFFPELGSRLGLIATFSVFAVGYFFRPLGSLYFGYLGDKLGRRIALQASILLMGISSLLIGSLPTYNSIGILAPILLVLLRCIQGFAVSGEFNGSAIYLIEHDLEKPCRAGSWTGFASALGMMFGGLMSTLISFHQMPVWAWRVPFLLGTLSCFCALYFRRNLSESPAFLAITKEETTNPLKILFNNYKNELLKAALLVASLSIYIYIMNVFYATHLAKYTTLQAAETKLIVTLAQGFVALFIFSIGILADQVNEQRFIAMGLIGYFIAAPLAYLVPQTNSFILILLAQIPYALCNALVGVPIFKLLNDFFPTHIRYSGVSIAWGVSTAIFGGTAPLVAVYLQNLFKLSIAPIFYILLSAAIALLILQRSNVG
ncbi:proline/glycine betaine transporter-like protein [Legionella gratiana]|uniref:Proline/glycine betaine transporter-like protein n=1 Tax=Legionella gratiana TaxID=45066 RepID=A0A378J882_9GAMM|nr:MFS transporter [Legionella gratiana]KTD10821.1 proline/glycine betaine transporter-like protein [Legionella gratiana]STX44014.1 proline/glycine betaine transporter-like protein [Legionella gratiana]